MKIRNVWIDIDNSPHVLIFRPIIAELQKQGVIVIITARDFAQTIQLLDLYQISFIKIGRHGGKNKILKILNLFHRVYQLYKFAHHRSFDIAISHGSRTQVVTAKILGIPSILMLDYEYTESKLFNLFATKILIPAIIPNERLAEANFNLNKVIRYNGLKEELYLRGFVPDSDIRNKLNVPSGKILALIRPPGMLGNYHDKKSEYIVIKLIEYLVQDPDVEVLIIARTKEDKSLIKNRFRNEVRFLNSVFDGPQLVWASDLFISGGGTMNREAALLNVPTYSIFTGKRPYVDEYLERKGKMKFVDSEEKVLNISIARNTNQHTNKIEFPDLATEIAEIITRVK